MEKCKLAILGAGNIAGMMAKTVQAMPEVELYAVAARDEKRAKAFAKKYGVTKAFPSYEAMVQDTNINLVYIATPHSHHFAHATLCINHNLPVLCEKAFTTNAAQAKELITLARSRKVFISEAIWTRFTPLGKKLTELIANGNIGQPTILTANLGFQVDHLPRMYEPGLAGGALLDLGVYPITFASLAFGADIAHTTSAVTMLHTGVDAFQNMVLHYTDGRIASLSSSMLHKMDNRGIVYGTEGSLLVESTTNFQSIRQLDKDEKEVAFFPQEPQITGYEYEVSSCLNALKEGQLECPEMPHEETIRIMELMDSFRQSWDMKYPME